jgi:type I restriction-modification system DNA methylase subunit
MRLSWNEIRARAASFADDWKDARYERAETQSFYNELFEVFGVKRRRVASFEEPVKLLGAKRGFIDLFWKGVLLVEQKSAGRSLIPAKQQALDYFPGLKDAELPRYILLSDFQSFELYDLEEDEDPIKFSLAALPQNIEALGFIIGVQKRTFRDQDPVNIKAAALMGRLHDSLESSGYDGHDLERFLVRILFCLFADDTGIFEPRDIFDNLIRERTREDGSDLGPLLARLFGVLDTPEDRRQAKLDVDLKQFPYINGDLFSERLDIPDFDSEMRERLLEACTFSWDAISPAIFGSLFQSVMNKKERRETGAHYTSEKNILRVIEPLFLDDLRLEFKRLLGRRDTGRVNSIKMFKDRLSELRLLDPACGCGNFLIIAYREIRLLETEALKALNPKGQRTLLDVATLSNVDVSQFYGIEIAEFPARIAEVALWMMDHIMNVRLSLEFGQAFARIPLKTSPHIINADALETEWENVLPASECSYVFGNPPFMGHHLQNTEQKSLLKKVYGPHSKSAGVMDFVTAWFLKSADYAAGQNVGIAFVATNSITQGEQVGILWRALSKHRLCINFAHRTFKWESEAKGKAAVYCVIIGLSQNDTKQKRLFDYASPEGESQEIAANNINAYLVDGPWVLVENRSKNLCGMPEMMYGSKPTDGGYFLFTDEEKDSFLRAEPKAKKYIKPFLSTKEYLYGQKRWVLWLVGADPSEMNKLPMVRQRIQSVAAFRKASKAPTTQQYPHHSLFRQVTQPKSNFILIPGHTSERRDYIPFGFFTKDEIVGNSCFALPTKTVMHFCVIQSAMHMAWVRAVCGRLESRFRYSKDIVYNNFPWPEISDQQSEKLELLGNAILAARALYPKATPAALYDPSLMPAELRSAHRALDRAVDRLYRKAAFLSDRERVEHLFGMLAQLTAPLVPESSPTSAKRGRKAKAAAE